MSTQLDPVTGAPLLTPDLGSIDQLPYKVQPVPLADQTNQPQLGRTYLYPDDVPPVLANLNAMNGTQPDQAQTLHTDGEHRLLVASSGGSSGGSPVPVTCYRVDESTIGFGTDSIQDMGPIGSVIYGLTMAFTSDDVPSGTLTHHGAVYAFIDSGGPSDPLVLASIAIEQATSTTANRYAGEVAIWYGNGITFPDALDPGNGKYRLQLQSTNIGGGHLIISVWCSA